MLGGGVTPDAFGTKLDFAKTVMVLKWKKRALFESIFFTPNEDTLLAELIRKLFLYLEYNLAEDPFSF